ncbi:DUF6709 family protein [Vallitalea sp.]|jgi:hypothetical protein|uniref:DUF6709 family protein n=1 Tax=Vallitalea sp. TaxID=1882829 RepID=UPI0025E9E57A|nr:DUF6709 family protein [Vallitalea sp.]MCT4686016.1 hypothetical protein [Vallitalea sp.]
MTTLEFIKKYRKKKYISFLILAILLISGAIIVNKCLISYDENTNNPTVINSIEDFNNAMANNDYIEMEISDYIDLGSVTTERNGSTISETFYIGINLNDKMLVVSIKDDEYHNLVSKINSKYLLRGTLCNITNNLRDTLEELLEDAISAEELNELMYDNFLSCETPIDALTSKILLLIFLFIMSCVFLYVLRKNSRSMRKLKKQHGSDFRMFCERVDAEMKAPTALKKGAITVTQNYIVANSPCTFFVMPINELMWIYRGVTRYYRIIEKSNITFVFSNKAKYQITSINKRNINDLIEYFSQEDQKCIVGFSEELNKMYRKQPDTLIQKWKSNDNQ